MNTKISIAVTGVGGGVGQSIIKSLIGTNYNVVALDGEVLATGLFASPKAYIIPYANHQDYIPTLFKICKEENCKFLFPGLDAELPILAQHKQSFLEIGTTIIVSDAKVIETADNKLSTYQFLSSLGFPTPQTMVLSDYISTGQGVPFPMIIKPKTGGARSKDVFLVKNQGDLQQLIMLKNLELNQYVAQEYIQGEEYTCGSINFDGVCYGVIVMKRTLRDGDTYKCFTEINPTIEQLLFKVYQHLVPFGACNIQLRMRDGIPYIFEINARCSGTTAARALAGFNEPKMIIDYLLKGELPSFSIKPTAIVRYWKELVIQQENIQILETEQKLINHSPKTL